MLQVAIRADASAQVGTGHLKRCLTLAHALRACGAQVAFVSRRIDGVAPALLQAQPFACEWLPQGASAEEEDARISAQAPAPRAAAWVVVDHYGLGAAWHALVRGQTGARIAAIDDLANRPLAPDLLLDPNLHADHAAKYRDALQGTPKLLSGPRYALLDQAYANSARYRVHDSVRSIGIFMGGTDPTGACLAAVRACRQEAGFQGPVEVVSSPLAPDYPALLALCARWPDTRVLDGLPHLADFFQRHDLQIGAGGGATWERCCIGVPTLACDVAPNQLSTLPALEAEGAVVWVRGGGDLARTLGQALGPLLRDARLRRGLSARAQALVDGRGAARVAAVLACAAGAPLVARPAGPADEERLLHWANDPQVRAQAFHPESIDRDRHAAWFRARLDHPDRCRISIVEAPNGVAAGQVRLERADEAWEIGYSLDPAFRQIGLGRRLLLAGVPVGLVPRRLVARVKVDNDASARIFRRLGFGESLVQDERGPHWRFTLDATGWPTARQ